jgi:hypothetical protein
MKQKDVTIYGKPDRNYKDEDDNVTYNKLKSELPSIRKKILS